MNNQVKQVLRILAGALFLLVAFRGSNGYIMVDNPSFIMVALSSISFVVLAVALFIQRDKLMIIGALIATICQLPGALGALRSYNLLASSYALRMVIWYLVFFLAFLFLFLCALKQEYAQSMCIAVVATVAAHFLSEALIVHSLHVALGNFPLLLAIILTAIILAEKAPKVITKATNQTVKKADTQIEELTKLKELMDMGAITQEEFDEKKKQLLGL